MSEPIEVTNNELTFPLGNQSFKVRREAWPVSKLKLDPANPRLGFALRAAGLRAIRAEVWAW